MTKLTLKSALFLLSIFMISNMMGYFILKSECLSSAFGVKKPDPTLYNVIAKSKSPVTSDVIILGDSVAKQLFKNEGYNFILNAPATIVGHYVVLNNILRQNKNVRKVFLVACPGSLSIKFDNTYTYNSFIKPFYNDENTPFFSRAVEKYLKEHRYYSLYKLPIAKVLPLFTLIDCSSYRPEKPDANYEYSLFIEYMGKIITLCKSNNVEFRILTPPLSSNNYNSIKFNKLKKVISDNNYQTFFSSYFTNIIVKDDSYFKEDHWHYKKEYESYMSATFFGKLHDNLSLPSGQGI